MILSGFLGNLLFSYPLQYLLQQKSSSPLEFGTSPDLLQVYLTTLWLGENVKYINTLTWMVAQHQSSQPSTSLLPQSHNQKSLAPHQKSLASQAQYAPWPMIWTKNQLLNFFLFFYQTHSKIEHIVSLEMERFIVIVIIFWTNTSTVLHENDFQVHLFHELCFYPNNTQYSQKYLRVSFYMLLSKFTSFFAFSLHALFLASLRSCLPIVSQWTKFSDQGHKWERFWSHQPLSWEVKANACIPWNRNPWSFLWLDLKLFNCLPVVEINTDWFISLLFQWGCL